MRAVLIGALVVVGAALTGAAPDEATRDASRIEVRGLPLPEIDDLRAGREAPAHTH